MINRGHFLVAAAAAAVPGGTRPVERAADFDGAAFVARLGRPAEIRQVWENLGFRPGVLNNVKNSLNGLTFGFGIAPERVAIAMASHGASSSYTFTDPLYRTYRIGEFYDLKDRDGKPVTSNVFLTRTSRPDPSASPDDPSGPYQDTSIEALQSRGVVFLTCHTAVEELSAALVKRGFAPSGMSAQDVANDILTHLIPGAVVVPSMVATLAVLQHRYGYTFATVQS